MLRSAADRDVDRIRRRSTLMRAAQHPHGIGNAPPFLCFVRLAVVLAGHRLLRGLRDRARAKLLQHLACDDVDLRLGHHEPSPDWSSLTAAGSRARAATIWQQPDRNPRSVLAIHS